MRHAIVVYVDDYVCLCIHWSTWPTFVYVPLVCNAWLCVHAPCRHCLRWWVCMLRCTDLRDQRSCTYFLFVMQDCCIYAPCGHCIRWWVNMLMYTDLRDQRSCTYFLFAMHVAIQTLFLTSCQKCMIAYYMHHTNVVYVDEYTCSYMLIYVTKICVQTLWL